jgi:hypothetical protein
VTVQPTEDAAPPAPSRSLTAAAASLALLTSGLAAVALGALVFTTDPDPREEELLAGLVVVIAAGLGATAILLFGRRSDSPLADTLRAFRRGLLLGLACSGAIVLQLNAALSAPNLGFLLLVLLIVEMVFLARRQHPA